LICVIFGLTLAAPAFAQPEDETRTQQVQRIHQALDHAQLSVIYTVIFEYPDHSECLASEYEILFDRPTSRLRISRPGFTVVCDGQTVFLRSDAIPNRHLEAPLEGPLTYSTLVRLVPDINDPVPPGLVMLLSDDPMRWLSSGFSEEAVAVKPREADAETRPRLRLATGIGEMLQAYNAESMLLEQVVVTADPKQLLGGPLVGARFQFTIDMEVNADPIADERFGFDTEGSEACATMADYLAPPAGANPGAGNGTTLIGLEMPDMELARIGEEDAVNLRSIEADVVIYEFFATWTNPSATDLPTLEAFEAWAEEEGVEVEVVLVNVLQKHREVSAYLERLGVDLPVLLDTAGDATMELRLPAIPRTLIVVDGKIVDALGGTKPEFDQMLRDRLPVWLGDEADGEDEAASE